MLKGRILFDRRGQFITILSRHVDVAHNQIWLELLSFSQRGITIIGDSKLIVLMRKSNLDDFLNCYTVVGQQQFLAHANLLETFSPQSVKSGSSTTRFRSRKRYSQFLI